MPAPNILFILQAQAILGNNNLHKKTPVSNFERITQLAQGESSSLGGVSAIVYILRGVDSGLVLENFTDQNYNVMSI